MSLESHWIGEQCERVPLYITEDKSVGQSNRFTVAVVL